MRFDGKKFAGRIEERVKARVRELGRAPKVVSVLAGNDPASELYTRLKKEAAERCGIEFEVRRVERGEKVEGVVKSLTESYDGVMVQMPIRGMSREKQLEVVEEIPLEKDVDGLRWERSGVVPATVRAVGEILKELGGVRGKRVVVVGDRGSVGRPLVLYLVRWGAGEVRGVNSETKDWEEVVRSGEVVISCTGREGLIGKDIVSSSMILIDVGAPRGDMTEEAYEKAEIVVGVPGGVGPVTVACLMESCVELL